MTILVLCKHNCAVCVFWRLVPVVQSAGLFVETGLALHMLAFDDPESISGAVAAVGVTAVTFVTWCYLLLLWCVTQAADKGWQHVGTACNWRRPCKGHPP